MSEALICDGVRTPIGRYGGALAAVRADDLAAVPIKALLARHPGLDPAAIDDVILGCANQAGEDNRNVARMALLLAGLPRERAGRHGQPAVRLGHGGDRPGGARDQGGRGEPDDRRRRREHDPRALRARQGAAGVRARDRALRHDDRLALRQPAAQGAVRHRRDARDRRERRGGLPGRGARTRTPSRCARNSAPPRRRPPAASPRRSSPVEIRSAAARRAASTSDEHPRPETTLERLAALPTPFRAGGSVTAGNASGVNDGAAARAGRLRGRRRRSRARAAGAHRRDGERRRRAAGHGHRPGAGDPQAARAHRPAASPTWR